MPSKKISEFDNSNLLSDIDLIEIAKFEDTIYRYQSKSITVQNFRDSLGANNHNIQYHSDTDATGLQLNTLTDGSNADLLHSHDTDHNIQSHSDTDATGVQLNTLTDGSNADLLHSHDTDHNIQSHSDTDATGSELDTLTDGSNADLLHSHDLSHSIQSHTDTNATGLQLNTLTDGSNADLLHSHDLENLLQLNVQPYRHARIGGGSMYFDGTKDFVYYPSNSDFYFGSNDFTIEGWFKFFSVDTVVTLVGQYAQPENRGFLFIKTTNDLIFYFCNGTTDGTSFTAGWTPIVDTWYHIAICRSTNDLRFFIDGNHIGSTFDVTGMSTAEVNQELSIGSQVEEL